MQNRHFISLLAICLVMVCCKKDDFTLFLNYDGDHFTSPTLPGGTYELAAKFSPSETADYSGSTLSIVDAYIVAEPQSVRLKVYGPGTGDSPGDVILSKDVTRDMKVDRWNRLELREPIEITGEEIWISLRIVLADQQQSVGCDAGPGHPDGGYVFLDDTDTWTTYEAWTGESINWNIRGGVK